MWFNGKTSIHWNNDFYKFDYVKKPVSPEQITAWKNLGYNHASFNGSMFANQKLIPQWCYKIADEIGLVYPGFTFYKMETNDIMPNHTDHFSNYCKNLSVHVADVYRAVVFLENWHSGHYFEINKQGIVNWTKGEYFVWSSDVDHAASNIGIRDRYTLQITGQLK